MLDGARRRGPRTARRARGRRMDAARAAGPDLARAFATMERMPSSLRRVARKLSISLATLVIFLGGAEIVCRIARKDAFRWISDPELQAVPQPDQEMWAGEDKPEIGEKRWHLRINRYSQRGEDYSLEKVAGETRLVVVGDSIAFGQGVNDEESFPALLA